MTRECNLGCKDVVNLFTQNKAYSSKANGHEYVCQLNMRQTEAGLKTDSTRLGYGTLPGPSWLWEVIATLC